MIKSKVFSVFKRLIACFLLGIICGFVGALFLKGVSFATTLRTNYGFLLYLLPVLPFRTPPDNDRRHT